MVFKTINNTEILCNYINKTSLGFYSVSNNDYTQRVHWGAHIRRAQPTVSNTNNSLCTLWYTVQSVCGLRERLILFMMKFLAQFSRMLHTGSPRPALCCCPASTLQPKVITDTERNSLFKMPLFGMDI